MAVAAGEEEHRAAAAVCLVFFFFCAWCFLSPILSSPTFSCWHAPRRPFFGAPAGGTVVKAAGVCIGRIPVMLRSNRCYLRDASEAELEAMKECPYDPGGYFVVKGVEKVCLIQEQLSKNRIILELDSKGSVSASVTSSTHERKSRTVIVLRTGRLQLQHNTIGDDVPVVVILKALGMTSDQEICAMIGPEPELQDSLSASLEEAAALGIYSQNAALEYIGGERARRTRSSIAAASAARPFRRARAAPCFFLFFFT